MHLSFFDYYFFVDNEKNGTWPKEKFFMKTINREFHVGDHIEIYGKKYKIIERYHRYPYDRTDLLIQDVD